MREDVLSLKAMAGDRVSQEYLKAELYHRAEALKDIPDAPLFFGRLDYADRPEQTEDAVAGHSFHIGRRHGVQAVLPGQRDRPDGPGAPAALRLLRQ